jgi:hypothetical protein
VADWLILFRPETYATVVEKGIIGVLDQHRRRFAELAPGDRFVAYLSQRRVLDGYGQITGAPYLDTSPVWSTFERYPQRCTVRFARTDASVDAGEHLWHLNCWPDPMKTTPSNYLFCKGGFHRLAPGDYDALVGFVDGLVGGGTPSSMDRFGSVGDRDPALGR